MHWYSKLKTKRTLSRRGLNNEKWLIITAVALLSACSSTENKSYYQPPVAAQGGQSTASRGNRLLWVEQVAVPDYLAGNGVVYQTSDVQYVIANNNLWASPLISSCATPWSPIWVASYRDGW